MSQIAAVEAALKTVGAKLNHPWEEWQRDDKGDETWWLHRDDPLICVVMDEEVLVGLSEPEVEVLVENSELEAEELALLEPDYLAEVYARPMPRSSVLRSRAED